MPGCSAGQALQVEESGLGPGHVTSKHASIKPLPIFGLFAGKGYAEMPSASLPPTSNGRLARNNNELAHCVACSLTMFEAV